MKGEGQTFLFWGQSPLEMEIFSFACDRVLTGMERLKEDSK